MMEKSLSITVPSKLLPLFFPLFQKGVLIKILSGSSIRDLIVYGLGISDAYLEERIQTIFLNGKAVDDLQAAIVSDGAILALSAAMPGLAGATLRRGGTFASFRQAITLKPGQESVIPKQGLVSLKLFNLLVPELSPLLLAGGVWLKGEDLKPLLETLRPYFAEINPEPTEEFETGDLIFLSVTVL
jgi:hypothetical protein